MYNMFATTCKTRPPSFLINIFTISPFSYWTLNPIKAVVGNNKSVNLHEETKLHFTGSLCINFSTVALYSTDIIVIDCFIVIIA